MRYAREAIQKMSAYVPGEQPDTREYLKLNTNENPFPPSLRVCEALRGSLLSEAIVRYPPPLCDALRNTVSQVYSVPPEWIAVGNGSDELLNLVFRVILNPGDKVAYPVPTYSLYRTLAQIQEAEPVEIPFPEDFTLPERFLNTSSYLKVVCNPNSPTGTVVSQDILVRLLESADCPVLIDEAYADFAPYNALPLLFRYPHLLVARTLSKSFSFAGLRVGLLFAQPELLSGILKIKDSYNVNNLSQIAAIAALGDLDAMQCNVQAIRATRDRFSRAMEERGFYVYPSQANFVLVRKEGRSLASLYESLKKEKIMVRYFPSLPDCLRISIGLDRDMDRLIDTIDTLLDQDGRKNVQAFHLGSG
ncbi:MAG TPA: histidinol-phosphate transaminase [Atribacteraceae bacterium]|nr:histidinol-phosphate transaminase [Atribacteraceae bacterium]